MKPTLTLLLLLLVSCGPATTEPNTPVKNVYVDWGGDRETIKLIVIDSCEYFCWYTYGGRNSFTHKGNCHFCEERRTK